MESQMEVLQFIKLCKHLGFDDTDTVRMLIFLAGEGSLDDLADLKEVVPNRRADAT
ncbi:MAG: hypothetical protein IJ679_00060 [Lachnospiraceae bacterium]|nr:hypothetical protein [Lachnospiraceae bacterium]